MTLKMRSAEAQSRFEARNALPSDHNYNYHHQVTNVTDKGTEVRSTTPKPMGDDYKQPGKRYDLMPYAQAANECPFFVHAQHNWQVDAGVITNALHCLGYHRVVQLFDMVSRMQSYRFNSGKYETEGQNRGAYFRACCRNEAIKRGKIWDAKDRPKQKAAPTQ